MKFVHPNHSSPMKRRTIMTIQESSVMAASSGASADVWSEQSNVTDANGSKTSKGPALAAYNGKLYLAFRGENSSSLHVCSFDGSSWSAQTNLTDLNGAETDDSPALAVYENKLYAVYPGEG